MVHGPVPWGPEFSVQQRCDPALALGGALLDQPLDQRQDRRLLRPIVASTRLRTPARPRVQVQTSGAEGLAYDLHREPNPLGACASEILCLLRVWSGA